MKLFRMMVPLLAMFAIASTAVAQNPATFGSAGGRYGLSAWAINNQRVASQYNYDIDSLFGGNAIGAGTYTFPIGSCTQALAFGGGRNVNPFNANASVRIVDIASANSETITPAATPVTYSGGTCTVNMTPSNAHSSFHLRSGTCGLREALNDMGGAGGEVLVDQKFYDDGCLQTTITGTTLANFTALQGNQYVHDISNGQDTWYAVKPLGTTLIAAPTAPVITVATGALSSGAYRVMVAYVDPDGGVSLASTDSTQTATTTGFTVASPAVSTGAVGYLVYITAAGGGTGTEILYPITSSVCTLSSETVIPACAIGATATVTGANPSSTAKPVVESTAHTTFGYVPVSGMPVVLGGATQPSIQTEYFPFVATATLNASAADGAQMLIPAGFFNYQGKSWDICVKGATGTQVASSTLSVNLTMANQYGQSPVTISTIAFPTQTQAAAGTFQGCWKITTAATGASGTFWAATPFGPWQDFLNTAPGTQVVSADASAAASSTIDLTKNIWLAVNLQAVAANNITAPIVNRLSLTPSLGN